MLAVKLLDTIKPSEQALILYYNHLSISALQRKGMATQVPWALATIRHKILTENIDEFDEFSLIHQYFPYQIFPFS